MPHSLKSHPIHKPSPKDGFIPHKLLPKKLFKWACFKASEGNQLPTVTPETAMLENAQHLLPAAPRTAAHEIAQDIPHLLLPKQRLQVGGCHAHEPR
eukprot:1060914-Pelagomonas_calceolata.AAC.1